MIVGGKNPGLWFGHNAWISAVISVGLWLARGGRNARPRATRQRSVPSLQFTDRLMTTRHNQGAK